MSNRHLTDAPGSSDMFKRSSYVPKNTMFGSLFWLHTFLFSKFFVFNFSFS